MRIPNDFRMPSERSYATLSSQRQAGTEMNQGRKRTGEPPDYIAFVLRLWRETDGEKTEWRASLQDPHSGDRVGFASLRDLFAFLENETGSFLPGSDPSDELGC